MTTPHAYLIGLAGGSASGKTTFAQALLHRLTHAQPALRAELLSTDAYFLPAGQIPTFVSPSTGLETPHYNRPDSLNLPALLADLNARRQSTPKAADVILLEGLMVLAIPQLRELCDLRLFLDAPGEVRALRRLVRNLGHSYDPIVGQDAAAIANYYLESAWVGHEQFVQPSRVYADFLLRGDGDFQRSASLIAALVRQETEDVAPSTPSV